MSKDLKRYEKDFGKLTNGDFIKLSKGHFSKIKTVDIIKLSVENSTDAAGSGGSDYYQLIYDIRNSRLLKVNDSDDKNYKFSDSYKNAIPATSQDFGKFINGVEISPVDDSWYIQFNEFLDNTSKNIDSKIKSEFETKVDAKSLFSFLTEVMNYV